MFLLVMLVATLAYTYLLWGEGGWPAVIAGTLAGGLTAAMLHRQGIVRWW